MKKYFQLLHILFLWSAILLHVMSSFAQTEVLPEMKFPDIEYKPSIKKGWVGQYVYELHFDGKSSLKTPKAEVPLYRVKTDRTHTGYVEFPTEIRGAIRVNQPDKNNKERYESWIRSGRSKSWSKVMDSIKSVGYLGRQGDFVNIGTLETNTAHNSNGNWVQGDMYNCDMQIDYTEGKYSFAVPHVSLEMEEEEWGVETYFKPAKNIPFQRKIKTRIESRNLTYLQFDEWSMITDSFHKDQKEIVIRKRIPVLLQQTTTQGIKDIKLPAVKGHIDFYMVLRKIPFSEDKKNNQSASSAPVNPNAVEPTNANANKPEVEPQKNAVKKPALSGLKNKINGIIKKN
jgi:hypothetical protein